MQICKSHFYRSVLWIRSEVTALIFLTSSSRRFHLHTCLPFLIKTISPSRLETLTLSCKRKKGLRKHKARWTDSECSSQEHLIRGLCQLPWGPSPSSQSLDPAFILSKQSMCQLSGRCCPHPALLGAEVEALEPD